MNEITYTLVGDFLLPDIILQENPEDVKPLGKYGRMHKAYLKEHRKLTYKKSNPEQSDKSLLRI